MAMGKSFEEVVAPVETLRRDGGSVEELPSKVCAQIGAFACKTLQDACKEGMCLEEKEEGGSIGAILRCVEVLEFVGPKLAFKNVLAVELLLQKAVSSFVDQKKFDVARIVIDSIFSLLVKRGFVTAELALVVQKIRKGDVNNWPDDGKLANLVVFCQYNKIRCLLDEHQFEKAFDECESGRLSLWLDVLGEPKNTSFAKSCVALLYHHAGDMLEKAGQSELAFQFRSFGLSIPLQFGGLVDDSDKENYNMKHSCALISKATAAAGQLLRSEVVSKKNSKRLITHVLNLYEKIVGALSMKNWNTELSLAILPFLEHYSYLLAENGFVLDGFDVMLLARAPGQDLLAGGSIKPALGSAIVCFMKAQLLYLSLKYETELSKDQFATLNDSDLATGIRKSYTTNPCTEKLLERIDKVLDKICTYIVQTNSASKKTTTKAKNDSPTSPHHHIEILGQLIELLCEHAEKPHPVSTMALRMLAERAVSEEDFPVALAHLKLAIEMSGEQTNLLKAVSISAYNIGATQFNKDAFQTALPFLQIACQNGPKSKEREKILGVCQTKVGAMSDSAATYSKLILRQVADGSYDAAMDTTSLFCKSCISSGNYTSLFNGVEHRLEDIVVLTRFQIDEFGQMIRWCRSDPSAEMVFEFMDLVIEDALALTSDEAGFQLMIDIEKIRLLWFQSFHIRHCNQESCNGPLSKHERDRLRSLADDKSRSIVDALEETDPLFNQVVGLGMLWLAISTEDRGTLVDDALELLSNSGEGQDYRILSDVSFAAEWCEYMGLHGASCRLHALAFSKGNVQFLVRIASQQEVFRYNSMLAKMLYKVYGNRLEEPIGVEVASKFYAYNFLDDDDAKNKENTELEALFGLIAELESHLENVPDESKHQRLLASLQFARGDHRNALSNAQDALKLRVAAAPNFLGPFSKTGIEWDHTLELADCLAMVGQIFESCGDPRSARYYYDQGKVLAERIGSLVLLQRFALLRSRIASKLNRLSEAEAILVSSKLEQDSLQSLVARIEFALFTESISSDTLKQIEKAKKLLHARSHDHDAFIGGHDEEEVAQTILKLLDDSSAGEGQLDGDDEAFVSASVLETEMFLCLYEARALLAVNHNTDKARRLLMKTIKQTTKRPILHVVKCQCLLDLGEAYMNEAEWEQAETYLALGVEESSVFTNPEFHRQLFRSYGSCLLHLGKTKHAEGFLRRSFSMALSLERVRLDQSCQELHDIHDVKPISAKVPDSMIICSVCLHGHSLLLMRKEQFTFIVQKDLEDSELLDSISKIIDDGETSIKGVTLETASSWDKKAKREWWDERKRLNAELSSNLERLENEWFGPYKALFAAPLCTDDVETYKPLIVDHIKEDDIQAAALFLREYVHGTINQDELTTVLMSLPFSLENGIISCIIDSLGQNLDETDTKSIYTENELTKLKVVELKAILKELNITASSVRLKKDMIARILEAQTPSQVQVSESDTSDTSEGGEEATHDEQGDARFGYDIVLILSEQLQFVPFESMPILDLHSVSRMPSMAFILDHQERLKTKQDQMKKKKKTKSRKRVGGSFVIDPRGDLVGTRETFRPFLDSMTENHEWSGMNHKNSAQEIHDFMKQSLAESELFLFCGHGSGEDFLPREQITKLNSCPTSFLMGCSSGKLRSQGIFEPSGVVLAYILAGAPAVVANLWDVTDKDIDRFTLSMLDSFLATDENVAKSLNRALSESRSTCKLRYLVGAAPICIGLPRNPPYTSI